MPTDLEEGAVILEVEAPSKPPLSPTFVFSMLHSSMLSAAISVAALSSAAFSAAASASFTVAAAAFSAATLAAAAFSAAALSAARYKCKTSQNHSVLF